MAALIAFRSRAASSPESAGRKGGMRLIRCCLIVRKGKANSFHQAPQESC
jgi:hypothetical protein